MPVLRLISVKDYHCMAEAGILRPEERVELVSGQILRLFAKGTAHSAAITRTRRLLESRLGEQVLIRLQDPIVLDDYSEPEPDIAVVVLDPLDYEDHHPTVSEVFLIIEIADSSLQYDCQVKAPVYAQSGIRDYWVLDVNARQLHVYRLPSPEGYQSVTVLAEEVVISPIAFPNCEITVKEMFCPNR